MQRTYVQERFRVFERPRTFFTFHNSQIVVQWLASENVSIYAKSVIDSVKADSTILPAASSHAKQSATVLSPDAEPISSKAI